MNVVHGDCFDVLAGMDACTVDAVVTDPPYGLEFMGKDWDRFSGAVTDRGFKGFVLSQQRTRNVKCPECNRWAYDHPGRLCECGGIRRAQGNTYQAWCQQWAAECLRILKPGGHLLAFGGTRTYHRMVCAVEDAGFEIRDTIAWMYGQGFSKSWNFDTMFKGEWCECPSGNAVPLDHASDADLHRLRDDIHPSTVARREGEGTNLFAAVQWDESRAGLGEARPQGSSSLDAGIGNGLVREDARSEEPGLGGRLIHRAGQGLSDGASPGSPTSESERLRRGALVGDGGSHRPSDHASGGSTSPQRRPSGQPAGEPQALSGSHESLDDRALRHGAVCSRCGGLTPFYRGVGTGLKPAHEPVVVARKPLIGTIAANVLEFGTGALNIDATRISTDDDLAKKYPNGPGGTTFGGGDMALGEWTQPSAGRWPANVVLDEAAAELLDAQTGTLTSGSRAEGVRKGLGYHGADGDGGPAIQGDSGGPSRFFYTAKASTHDRGPGNDHPTTKPVELMRWLIRLVTPPGGLIVDPFAGSGTTGVAAVIEGRRCILIEKEPCGGCRGGCPDYVGIIRRRLAQPIQPVLNLGDTA